VLGICYHNLANEEEFFNNYENAAQCYQTSINILTENLGKDHFLTKKFIVR